MLGVKAGQAPEPLEQAGTLEVAGQVEEAEEHTAIDMATAMAKDHIDLGVVEELGKPFVYKSSGIFLWIPPLPSFLTLHPSLQ